MAFLNTFGLDGGTLTYRGFWVMLTSAMIVWSALLNAVTMVAIWFMMKKLPYPKAEESMHWGWTVGICVANFLYALMVLVVYILFGTFIFGDWSAWIYFAFVPVVYVLFLVAVFFMRRIRCTEWAFGMAGYTLALQAWFGFQIPTMWNYTHITWLVGIAASLPLLVKVAHTFGGPVRAMIRKPVFWVAQAGALLFGIFITYGNAGTCIAVYNPIATGLWIQLEGTLFWSSRLTRSFGPKACPDDAEEPCHVYLTAAQNLTNGMFVNVHMSTETKFLKVHYNMLGQSESETITADQFAVPNLDDRDQRNVYAVFVSGLTPDSVVEFTIESDKKHLDKKYTFKTAPLTGEVKFVIGGDAGTSNFVQEVNSHIGQYSPLFAVNGGDVSYDNALFSCACVWDTYLQEWDLVRTPEGHMIPLIFAVGNHDVGANDSNGGAIDSFMNPETCDDTSLYNARPLYFAYFPFEEVNGKAQQVCERDVNHVHYAGDAVTIWSIDSLYAGDAATVVDFVEQRIEAYNGTVNHFAAYHVPMYPNDNLPHEQAAGKPMRDLWPTAIFDKYAFKSCFEHHAHVLKRTSPMTNNEVAEGGVIYVGDGKWGTTGSMLPQYDSLDFGAPFKTTGVDYHVWHVKASTTGDVGIFAIDNFGKKIDEVDNYANGHWEL